MIIIDGTGPQRADVDKGNSSARAETRMIPGLPQTPPPPPPYNPQTSYQASGYYPVTPVVVVYHESPVQRFWKAFGVAVLVWFLLGAFTKSFTDMAYHSRPVCVFAIVR